MGETVRRKIGLESMNVQAVEEEAGQNDLRTCVT